MNQQQITGLIRILLGAGTPLAAFLSAHGFNTQSLADWVIAGIPVVMGIWSFWANNHVNQVKAAGEIPGVKVVVSEAASSGVQGVAEDKSVQNVNMEKTEEPPKNPPPLNIRRKS